MADIRQYTNVIRTANSGESVRDAIINCMKDINADSAIRATNLAITKNDNVTYTAPKGYAFKNVTVNIDSSGETDPDKTYTFEEFSVNNETENGEYVPEGDNKAYSKVIVDINWDILSSNVGEEATMTHVTTDPATGMKYWDAITDSEYTAVKRVWIGSSAGINLPDYPGGPSGTGGNGPFTVTFYDEKNTKIGSVSQIPYGASAYTYMSGDLEEKVRKIESNGKFSYWAPRADYVTGNYAVRPQMVKTGAGGSLDQYTWDEIIAKQSSFPVGSTVNVISETVTVPATKIYGKPTVDMYGSPGHAVLNLPEHTYNAGYINFKAMIVAHGEGLTQTTWLATTPLGKLWSNFRDDSGGSSSGLIDGLYGETTGCDDGTSYPAYQLLDKYVYYFFPEALRKALKQDMNKAQWGFSSYDYSITDIRSNQGSNLFSLQTGGKAGRIWLPSQSEIRGLFQSAIVEGSGEPYNACGTTSGTWSRWHNNSYTAKAIDPHVVDFNEGNPRDYSSVWLPTDQNFIQSNTTAQIVTRSAIKGRYGANQMMGSVRTGMYYPGDHHDSPIMGCGSPDMRYNWYIGFNT